MGNRQSNGSAMQRFEAFVQAILSVPKTDILKAVAVEKRANAQKRAAKARKPKPSL